MRNSLGIAATSLMLVAATLGASCQKKKRTDGPTASPTASPTTTPIASPSTSPVAGGGDAGSAQVVEFVPGVDIGALSEAQRTLFTKLAGSLPSPCGKAHSLETSAKTDPACKRAPYALRYLRRLMQADMTDEEAKAIYDLRYNAKAKAIDVASTPVVGNATAPVVLVEFFDYQCPHCKHFAPTLHALEDKYGSKIAVFYKNFPLEHFGEKSVRAAQAARAAFNQGKFRDMHQQLFEHNDKLTDADLIGYAKGLGLDVQKFKDDLDQPSTKARIEADKKLGETLGVEATPTLYFNGHEYTDPKEVADIADWIDEELAQRGQ